MKKYKNLYSAIYDFENLYGAYRDARKGKKHRNEVLEFSVNLEENLIQIQNELIWKTYKVSPYRQFFVYEPKRRLIMALPFRDRVVQWAIYRVLHPLIEKRFIRDSYACRIGFGTHKALGRLREWLKYLSKQGQPVYTLKMDIAKYFYRIDHDILMRILRRLIEDADLLWLLEEIIRCNHTKFGISLQDLDYGELIGGVGMPIGNLTSQMFANIYLNEADQFAKHQLREKYYIRYMDDILNLGPDKRHLWQVKNEMERFLQEELNLQLNRKTGISTISQGVDWVGYRVWPTHIRLRKTTAKRMKRRLRRLQKLYAQGEVSIEEVNSTVQSYMGQLKHCDSFNLRTKLFEELLFVRKNVTEVESDANSAGFYSRREEKPSGVSDERTGLYHYSRHG